MRRVAIPASARKEASQLVKYFSNDVDLKPCATDRNISGSGLSPSQSHEGIFGSIANNMVSIQKHKSLCLYVIEKQSVGNRGKYTASTKYTTPLIPLCYVLCCLPILARQATRHSLCEYRRCAGPGRSPSCGGRKSKEKRSNLVKHGSCSVFTMVTMAIEQLRLWRLGTVASVFIAIVDVEVFCTAPQSHYYAACQSTRRRARLLVVSVITTSSLQAQLG